MIYVLIFVGIGLAVLDIAMLTRHHQMWIVQSDLRKAIDSGHYPSWLKEKIPMHSRMVLRNWDLWTADQWAAYLMKDGAEN